MTDEEVIKRYKEIHKIKRDLKRSIRINNIQNISKNNKELKLNNIYPIVLADPPWHYSFGNEERNIQINYPTMSFDEICSLPIKNITQPNALMFMWATSPKLEEAMNVINRWGFIYKTCAVWVKSSYYWILFSSATRITFNCNERERYSYA